MGVPSLHFAAALSLKVICVIPASHAYGPSARRGYTLPSSMLNRYGVSNMMTRALSCSLMPRALLQLTEYGFQQTTAPHCWPLKYRVSLRGRAAPGAGLAVGAGVAVTTTSFVTGVPATTT